MNLSSTLISRLTALKSLLGIKNVMPVAVDLDEKLYEPLVQEIKTALAKNSYADVARMIEKIPSEVTQSAQWIDTEICLLETQYELLLTQLIDQIVEHTDLVRNLQRYHSSFDNFFGARLAKLLNLRMIVLMRDSEKKLGKKSAYLQAIRDFEDFEIKQDNGLEKDAFTMWDLSLLTDKEQKELKRLYRQGVKLCHPDLVSLEHKELAWIIFMELQWAYAKGHLPSIREVIKKCKAEILDSGQKNYGKTECKKQILLIQIAQTARIQEALNLVWVNTQAILQSNTYKVLIQRQDWQRLFTKKAELLDQEIEYLGELLIDIKKTAIRNNEHEITFGNTLGLIRGMDDQLDLVNRNIFNVAIRNNDTTVMEIPITEERPGDECDWEIAPGLIITFCWCPPGHFLMGNPSSASYPFGNNNQVRVTIKKGFWMAKNEITQAQWMAIMNHNPSNFKGENLPVESVSWKHVESFVERVNCTGVIPSDWKIAMPTEAQWEYACRTGLNGNYTDESFDQVAWYYDNSNSKTHQVGMKKANAWGLHDMLGNVWEWCADRYDASLQGGIDPSGPSLGVGRVIRGGSWYNSTCDCYVTSRYGRDADYRSYYLGFRPVIVKFEK